MNSATEPVDLTHAGEGAVAALNAQNEKLLCYGRELEGAMLRLKVEWADQLHKVESGAATRIAELSATIDALQNQVLQLSKQKQAIALFSNMNDFLQSSVSEAEAYSIIAEAATQLFPDDSGAVFVLNASRDMLEASVTWGKMPPATLTFPPDACWAERRGQVHLVLGYGQRCPHVTDQRHMYVCLPLLSQGEMLGVLHLLDGPVRNDKADEARMMEKSELATRLADHIGLGIANLKMRESLRNLSIRDPLTGLFNRRYMEESLMQEQYRIRRSDTHLAVIMIDIDHFKAFNDNFGHGGGDAILRGLGDFLKKHVRGGDLACRYGGEEFVLILSPSTAEGARQRAEQVRQDAMSLGASTVHPATGGITLSLGIALFPDHASDVPGLIKAADVALYQAKRGGRNRVAFFSEPAEPALVRCSECP